MLEMSDVAGHDGHALHRGRRSDQLIDDADLSARSLVGQGQVGPSLSNCDRHRKNLGSLGQEENRLNRLQLYFQQF